MFLGVLFLVCYFLDKAIIFFSYGRIGIYDSSSFLLSLRSLISKDVRRLIKSLGIFFLYLF